MNTYSRIMSGAITFPVHVSRPAQDLIRKLLNPKAAKRYGSLAGGATLIKSHPWSFTQTGSERVQRGHESTAIVLSLTLSAVLVCVVFSSGSPNSTGTRFLLVACLLRSFCPSSLLRICPTSSRIRSRSSTRHTDRTRACQSGKRTSKAQREPRAPA